MGIAEPNPRMHLVFIQYGDYREAWLNLQAGDEETYQAQKISVEFVVALAKSHDVTVICVNTNQVYDDFLECGIRSIGLGPDGPPRSGRYWMKMLSDIRADLVILRTPLLPALHAAIRSGSRILVTLADSFHSKGVKAHFYQWKLKRALNHPLVEWVGNHGRQATGQLPRIGVDPGKSLPWDWPPSRTPHESSPKKHGGPENRVVFVGMLSQSKGLGDLIDAVALLVERQVAVSLKIVGGGDAGVFEPRIEALGIGPHIHFEGLVANARVAKLMREADAVVVPSRHDYPEGLPLTIYEAFCSRTPLIVSDHPMFLGNVIPDHDGLMFKQKDSKDLALKLEMLFSDEQLYARLSENSAAAWERLQLPVVWMELVERWVQGGDENVKWIKSHALSG